MPELRPENALSVGAKTVTPLFVSFSWRSIWSRTVVAFSNRIKKEKWPTFSRILVKLVGPEEAGPAAPGRTRGVGGLGRAGDEIGPAG